MCLYVNNVIVDVDCSFIMEVICYGEIGVCDLLDIVLGKIVVIEIEKYFVCIRVVVCGWVIVNSGICGWWCI